jgi:hypothetical protein
VQEEHEKNRVIFGKEGIGAADSKSSGFSVYYHTFLLKSGTSMAQGVNIKNGVGESRPLFFQSIIHHAFDPLTIPESTI